MSRPHARDNVTVPSALFRVLLAYGSFCRWRRAGAAVAGSL